MGCLYIGHPFSFYGNAVFARFAALYILFAELIGASSLERKSTDNFNSRKKLKNEPAKKGKF
ncbi:hypothetical protein ABE67_06810 [Cytobacillus firmus]|nr:hypothetical protein [Cytobacillus firmus]